MTRVVGVVAYNEHEVLFLSGRNKLRKFLRDGVIGTVRHVKLVFRSDSRADVDRPWNWWSDEKQGGGTLGAIGSHVIDGFRWLLGTEVSEVCCNLATHIRERKDEESGDSRAVTTDDEANLLLRFAQSELTDGATGNVSLSMVEPGKSEHRLEIFGSLGALMINEAAEVRRADVGTGEWEKVETEPGELAPGMPAGGWPPGLTPFSKPI